MLHNITHLLSAWHRPVCEMELMWKLRKQGAINGGPPYDSDINQEEEVVQLIN